jgi:hypothetical protein
MATVALDTAGVVDIVLAKEPNLSMIGATNIVASQCYRPDSNGAAVLAVATAASNGAGARLALRTAPAGEPVSFMRSGVVDGFNVSQTNGAVLYLSDTGTVADAPGTVTIILGRVIPGNANVLSAARDKVVEVDLPE